MRQVLTSRFDHDEFRILCSELEVSYDDLGGSGRLGKAHALIEYLEHRERIPDLFAAGMRLRSDISWDQLQDTYKTEHAPASHP